jgi:hypothetical protein
MTADEIKNATLVERRYRKAKSARGIEFRGRFRLFAELRTSFD